jgi:hypothetical protein
MGRRVFGMEDTRFSSGAFCATASGFSPGAAGASSSGLFVETTILGLGFSTGTEAGGAAFLTTTLTLRRNSPCPCAAFPGGTDPLETPPEDSCSLF